MNARFFLRHSDPEPLKQQNALCCLHIFQFFGNLYHIYDIDYFPHYFKYISLSFNISLHEYTLQNYKQQQFILPEIIN